MFRKVTKIKGIIIVNKEIPLPIWYNPGLNKEMMMWYDKMYEEAKKEGLKLDIVSGFRSYLKQRKEYLGYVKKVGKVKADTFSAKPGHSEHQTGLALDILDDTDNFIDSKEAIWLAKNAHKFGFIIRYPKERTHITGYKYEPWHIRYVGVKHAKRIFNKRITLEEYLGIHENK